jgi:hypothetical protein
VRVLGILAAVTLVIGLSALWIGARRRGTAQQSKRGRISFAVVRYLGLLPADPTRLERLVWVRRVSFRMASPFIPMLILVALYIDKTWTYAVLGVLGLLWLESLVGVSLDIRRERLKNGADTN